MLLALISLTMVSRILRLLYGKDLKSDKIILSEINPRMFIHVQLLGIRNNQFLPILLDQLFCIHRTRLLYPSGHLDSVYLGYPQRQFIRQ